MSFGKNNSSDVMSDNSDFKLMCYILAAVEFINMLELQQN